MSELLKRLKAEQLNAISAQRALLDAVEAEGRDLSGEEAATFAATNEAYDTRAAHIDEILATEQRMADYEASIIDIPKADTSSRERDLNAEFRTLGLDRTAGPLTLDWDRRDQTKTAAQGGNTVPTSFAGQLFEHMIEVSAVLQAGPTIWRTSGGENFEVPVTTTHPGAALIAEGSALTETQDAVFAKRTLGAYKYAMSIQVSNELVADTGVDLLGYLARSCGRAVGNVLGTDLVVGNASSKPSGIVQTASTGVTGATAVSGAFTPDNLIDLYYSVIAPYRNSSSCGWIMRDATLATARKFREGTGATAGAYLWQPSIAVGVPDTLLGKPVYTDPNVAAVAISAKSVIFGDISAYHVRLAGGLRFERSDEFAFQNDLVTFRCIARGDGILADQTGAVKVFVGGAS